MPAFPLRHVPALVSPKAGLEASLPAAPGCFLQASPSGCHAVLPPAVHRELD